LILFVKNGNLIISLIYIIYQIPAEYPALNGGDECGAGVRVMQALALIFMMPRLLRRGVSLLTNLTWLSF
jgi:hypothetical protein